MDPDLYKSAQDGNLNYLKQHLDFLVKNNGGLPEQLTTSNNNLLHVLSQFGDFDECVNGVLDTQNFEDQQLMLTCQNSLHETPLHIASRNGHVKIVHTLIQRAQFLDSENLESATQTTKTMLRAMDKHGDTALHNAVKNMHKHIVQLLVLSDPHFKHLPNKMEETPLYLAVERGDLYHEIVGIILTICSSPGYEGPAGKTALHAAVLDHCSVCVSGLLEKKLALAKQADKLGWIPLHVAAYVDGKLMRKLLEYCPDSWDVVTNKSQNILHLVALSKSSQKLGIILDERWGLILDERWAINLINQKDEEGNTPLHSLLVNFDPWRYADTIKLLEHPHVDRNAVNKEGFTPRDVVKNQEMNREEKFKIRERLRKIKTKEGTRNLINEANHEDERMKQTKREKTKKTQNKLEEVRKFGQTQLVVATLIATVTFAAGFTLPGGYNNDTKGPNQGMAVLVQKTAFKTFVVSDAVAVTSSLLFVFLHFVVAFHRLTKATEDDGNWEMEHAKLYINAMVFLVIGKIAMIIAFITGLYTVLSDGCLGLAISVCCLGFFALVYFFYKLLRLSAMRKISGLVPVTVGLMSVSLPSHPLQGYTLS